MVNKEMTIGELLSVNPCGTDSHGNRNALPWLPGFPG